MSRTTMVVEANDRATAAERLRGVENARRRTILTMVSAALCLLSIAAGVLLVAIAAAELVTVATISAAVLFGVGFVLARKETLEPGVAAGLVVGGMLVQHVLAGWGLGVVGINLTLTMAFSALCPLIAAATMSTRGTALTTLAAAGGVSTVVFAYLARGVSFVELGQTLGGPFFLVLISGATALVLSRAGEIAREKMAEEAQAALDAMRAVAAAETRFRMVADRVSDLVAVLDEEARYTFASASFEDILGRAPADLLGTTTPELIDPDDVPVMSTAFLEALGGTPTERVVRLRSAEGESRPFHVRMVRVDVEARPHVVVTSRDVSVLQRLNTELERVRRMDALGKLAGGVAHDFNNLLLVIGACSEMTRTQVGDRRDVAVELDALDEAVTQASNLTAQLLAFARGQLLPIDAAVPSEVVSKLAPLLERVFRGGTRLEVDASSTTRCKMTAPQLEQLLMNLALNARDAMPEGGTFSITIKDRTIGESEIPELAAGEYVHLAVRDTGVGMSDEVKARIFEPFFTTKPGQGTGLGLSTGFGIIGQLGGRLDVESTLGQGSLFNLWLPVADEPAPPARKASTSVETAPTEGPVRVLAVDDEPAICKLVARILGRAGFDVVTATNRSEALEAARLGPFHVILTDVVLGTDDGIEVLDQLRAMHPDASAVVMSGFSHLPNRLDPLRRDGVELLSKPFRPEQLVAAAKRSKATRPSAVVSAS